MQVAAFEMPFSSFASQQAKVVFVTGYLDQMRRSGQPADADAAAMRKRTDEEVILPILPRQQALWPDAVDVEPREIRGVHTEVFTPKAGVADANRDRVLVNLHGGGFVVGGRTHGRLESIPIAALGQITVVSVDCRMAPEHTFPAASEDVSLVYEELLNTYRPENIGIYGSSAGGTLTAQAVSWFIDKNIPVPGAVWMLGGVGHPWWAGDPGHLVRNLYGMRQVAPDNGWKASAYRKDADVDGPLVKPMLWPEVLAKSRPRC